MNSPTMRRGLFLTISVLSLGAGFWFNGSPALDLQCSGRIAQAFSREEQTQWLLSQYDLDLRAEGEGDYKVSSRLLIAHQDPPLGYLHRAARFTQQLEGQRLLIQVLHSGKSATDNLQPEQLSGLGLFVFNKHLHLRYRLRQLAAGSLVIDNGLGAVLLCVQTRPAT
ncbi:hypothetical protein ACVW0Y_000930 [Pseudomonas sp. TE3786]